MYEKHRMRRLRKNESMRSLVKETEISIKDLVYPLFVVEGKEIKTEIPSMPGVYHYSLDKLPEILEEIWISGIRAVLFFGIPEYKDEVGSGAYDENGIVQRALRISKELYPDILLISDVCLCEYTSHGHCGLIKDGKILNDETLDLLAKTALSHAKAGADIVAPSDMMDKRVEAIRMTLEEEGFKDTVIMSYSAKYSSSFYGPFRDAAGSAPQFGDRKTYQMDYANSKEAMLEIQSDIQEGADIIMIKPAMSYLDIVRNAADCFDVPVAAYNVSGEYAMIKAAAEKGWIDEKGAVMELLTSIRRAGAKIIITYHALDVAKWLKE